MSLTFGKIAKALLLSLAISVTAILVFSVAVYFADFADRTILTSVMLLSALSVFAGAFVLARSVESGGLVNGFILGTAYFAVLAAVSFAVKGSLSFGSQGIFRFASVLAAGMLGGVTGINARRT